MKHILALSSYGSLLALTAIDKGTINEIEKFINEKKDSRFNDFDCSHSEYYTNQKKFSFSPGHSSFLLGLAK